MPKTNPRVLHGIQTCEDLFAALCEQGEAVVRLPIRRDGSRKGRMLCRINVYDLVLSGFQYFYKDTELMMLFGSATAVIDAVNHTIILTHVRLKHRRKDLPKEVHDLRVY